MDIETLHLTIIALLLLCIVALVVANHQIKKADKELDKYR